MNNMKKSLVVAVGAALSAVSFWAAADVKVGGMAQVEIAREQTKNAAGVTTSKLTTVEDNTRGRFWITADEDLGGGMKGLAYYEFSVDTTGVCALEGTTPTGACGAAPVNANTREKYVGLQTNMGTIKLGSNRNPNQFLGGVYWDAFVTTNLEARGNGGMSGTTFGHIGYFDNSLRYESPNWGGFGFEFVYSFDDVSTASTTDDGDYAIGAQWKGKIPGGDLHVVAVHAQDANNSAGPAGDKIDRAQNKIGARYDFLKDYSIMGQYETIDNDANTLDQKIYYLGFQANFGKVLAAVQLGKIKDDITHNDTDYLAVGAWYNFSKTFRVLAGYRKTEIDNGNQDKILSTALLKLF